MGRGIAVQGSDSAGGTHLAGGQSLVRINGQPVVLKGDRVAGHGDGAHAGPGMVEGSSLFRINGVPVVLEGHRASCGHPSTGRPLVRVSR